MLTHAVEYPNDRGFWYFACNDSLPESDELFPNLLRKHFGDISMSTLCVFEIEKKENDTRFEKFEGDWLKHFRQLKKSQLFSVQKKLMFALQTLEYEIKA